MQASCWVLAGASRVPSCFCTFRAATLAALPSSIAATVCVDGVALPRREPLTAPCHKQSTMNPTQQTLAQLQLRDGAGITSALFFLLQKQWSLISLLKCGTAPADLRLKCCAAAPALWQSPCCNGPQSLPLPAAVQTCDIPYWRPQSDPVDALQLDCPFAHGHLHASYP